MKPLQIDIQPIGVLVIIIFVVTYVAISSEKVNRTAMSMTGMAFAGFALWIAHTIDPSQGTDFTNLVSHIEWHTILFVMAMMVIVSVAGASGMFQYLALTLAKPSGGDTKHLFIVLLTFVWAVSLFFDTTSTILIMAPLTIEICRALEIDFKPFLISEAIVANFGSIPSVVGAVPNLVIASKTGVDAGLMFLVLMPLSAILFIITLVYLLALFEPKFVRCPQDLVDDIFDINPQNMIKSRRDFYASIIAIIVLILGFTAGSSVGIEPAMVAVTVAFAMLLMNHERVNVFLARIGWGTIFFLIGIFGLVTALEITGVIDAFGDGVSALVGDSMEGAAVLLTWLPAGLSAIVDNIPVSVVLAPVALEFASISPVFTFALITAVNIGGYLLPMGAPANLMAIGLAEEARNPISFVEFAKVASLLAILHLLVASGWFLLVLAFL
ncbi:MAG: hypothetical protein KGY80_03370 [Candidatus Thorarchaeota archaeon]|nr:hypothetical protein [Candidatus Thorarchaeota archaeon]